MSIVFALIWFGVLIAFFAYFFSYGLSHIYDYGITETGVEFWIFGFFPILTIRFEAIERAWEMRIFSSVDNRASSIFKSLVIGNRLATKFVVLKMKSGPFRYIALTPADRDTFLSQLTSHLEEPPRQAR